MKHKISLNRRNSTCNLLISPENQSYLDLKDKLLKSNIKFTDSRAVVSEVRKRMSLNELYEIKTKVSGGTIDIYGRH